MKTVCLYLLTAATGTTTTASTKEDTSASGGVRYVALIVVVVVVDTCKQRTIFRVLIHVGNSTLMFPLSGKTPEPPPPHDGNVTSLYDMAKPNTNVDSRSVIFSLQPQIYMT